MATTLTTPSIPATTISTAPNQNNTLLLDLNPNDAGLQSSNNVPIFVLVDQNLNAVNIAGKGYSPDMVFGQTGVIEIPAGYRAVAISNDGNSSATATIYAADGTTVLQTRTIPSGRSASMQVDSPNWVNRISIDAGTSSVSIGVI